MAGVDFLRFVGALLVVIALMLGFAYVMRRWGSRLPDLMGNSGPDKRLAVLETRAIDARTKLVLVRRDSREHLLVISQTGATLVDSTDNAVVPPIQSDSRDLTT